MTDQPTPGQPLTAESVGLLKKGDLLSFTIGGDKLIVGFEAAGETVRGSKILWHTGGGSQFARLYTYLGRPGPDGFIPWSGGENPVPGMRVDVRLASGLTFHDTPSDEYGRWWIGTDTMDAVTSFRPSQPIAQSGGEPCDCVRCVALAEASGDSGSFRPEEAVIPSRALADIAAERLRQVEVEGWSVGHDDEHDDFQMARAAACYAMNAGKHDTEDDFFDGVSNAAIHHSWPWDRSWWKPKDRRRDLIRAGALIVAEIERLDRKGDAS